ncbi:MAG: HpaII family restriction endonuclease [Bacteroidia bacterium]|nr:HpaII family restriction endonuclease [Bacteroidia bacterium]MBP7261414.1 HpaII family restriction endonuclease [Bacteroidia bacterium]MBP9180961.1 HpaII family restriction endonuclease [Bacteroidia bacterium]MBP9725065.1 HpaII family restriction endonuclease [Bacteroidia bacterium]
MESSMHSIPQADFINLKNLVLAEYKINYHINDCFSINKLEDVSSKHQLLFQKFESRVQQSNLLFMVDSIFPIILSDLALDVLLGKVTSFSEYIYAKRSPIEIGILANEEYLKYKFFQFVHSLLYSDVSSKKVCDGTLKTNKVFCIKNESGEIDFYTFYEQQVLQLLLLDKLKLEIDLKSSTVSKFNVKINLLIHL